jgi:hypothetical protein
MMKMNNLPETETTTNKEETMNNKQSIEEQNTMKLLRLIGWYPRPS